MGLILLFLVRRLFVVQETPDPTQRAPASRSPFTGLQLGMVDANGITILEPLQERAWPKDDLTTAKAVRHEPGFLDSKDGHLGPTVLACHGILGFRLFRHINQFSQFRQSVYQYV